MTKDCTRRSILKGGVLAATAMTGLTSVMPVHAAENNTLKIGLVGCGNRGCGAVGNAFAVDPNIRLHAVGDALPGKAASAVEGMRQAENLAPRIDVTPETTFSGFDAYKKVTDICDVVFLTQPPHFRPESLRYAVEKGKHAFCEKPMAVDGAGIKSVLESTRLANEKNVNILSGFCFRYDPNIVEMVNRIRDGAIGDVVAIRANFLTTPAWVRNRLPGDTEMMYQIRNWYNFAWLSGDFLVERTVHSMDKSLLVMNDQVPDSAYGTGGRMRRTGPHALGDLYDTFSTVYEYNDGRAIFAFGSELSNTLQEREEIVMGTKGTAHLMKGVITGENPMTLKKLPGNPFELEHAALFKAIRSGGAIRHNDGEFMAKSSMVTILGRLAGLTGKRLTWQQALDMELPMTPSAYDWDAVPPTLPDEKGRYKVHVAGMGPVYHEIVR